MSKTCNQMTQRALAALILIMPFWERKLYLIPSFKIQAGRKAQFNIRGLTCTKPYTLGPVPSIMCLCVFVCVIYLQEWWSTFNPRMSEPELGESLTLRPAWSTKQLQDSQNYTNLVSETNNNKKINKIIKLVKWLSIELLHLMWFSDTINNGGEVMTVQKVDRSVSNITQKKFKKHNHHATNMA